MNNQMVRKVHDDGSDVRFSYNASGKLEEVRDHRGITRHFYDLRNRLIEVENPDGSWSAYTYDDKGNRTAVITDNGETSYTFDALSRLSGVTGPDGGFTSNKYDTVGNRSVVTYPNGSRTSYTYDAVLARLGQPLQTSVLGQSSISAVETLRWSDQEKPWKQFRSVGSETVGR